MHNMFIYVGLGFVLEEILHQLIVYECIKGNKSLLRDGGGSLTQRPYKIVKCHLITKLKVVWDVNV